MSLRYSGDTTKIIPCIPLVDHPTYTHHARIHTARPLFRTCAFAKSDRWSRDIVQRGGVPLEYRYNGLNRSWLDGSLFYENSPTARGIAITAE